MRVRACHESKMSARPLSLSVPDGPGRACARWCALVRDAVWPERLCHVLQPPADDSALHRSCVAPQFGCRVALQLASPSGTRYGGMHAQGEAVVATADAANAAGASAAEWGRKYAEHADVVLQKMWGLHDDLMFKYADGYITTLNADGSVNVKAEPYPDWWLREVGYQKGPPPVPPPKVQYV